MVFVVIGLLIVMGFAFSQTTSAQQAVIMGNLTSVQTSNPLPGVNIFLAGFTTAQIRIMEAKGNYGVIWAQGWDRTEAEPWT